MHVFWAQGYASTSTRALLQAMGLSRSSLYQTFGTKEQLFLACLAHYRRSLTHNLRQRLAEAPGGLAFLETLFTDAAMQAETPAVQQGCLVFNSVVELGSAETPPAGAARESLNHIAVVFTEALEQAQREGDVDPNADAESLGLYLAGSMSGLRMLLKSGAPRKQTTVVAQTIINALPRPAQAAEPLRNTQTETSTTVPTR